MTKEEKIKKLNTYPKEVLILALLDYQKFLNSSFSDLVNRCDYYETDRLNKIEIKKQEDQLKEYHKAKREYLGWLNKMFDKYGSSFSVVNLTREELLEGSKLERAHNKAIEVIK